MVRSLVTAALLLSASFAALAATPVSEIGTAAVAEAIFAAHPELAGDRVELPEAIIARAAAPAMTAGPLEQWGAGADALSIAHVRIRCEGEGVCLPFYAMVDLAPGQSFTEPAARVAARPVAQSPARAETRWHAPPPPVLRSGDHAVLLIDSGPLHLRIHVTCLGSGVAGSTIRVEGPNRRDIYEASIVDDHTLRGTL